LGAVLFRGSRHIAPSVQIDANRTRVSWPI